MCGIIGAASKKEISPELLGGSVITLAQRGPDDHGIVPFPHAVLAHTRLSIIDLATGHQPMRDSSRDVVIVFNGEIYNYKELRKELEQKGHHFSTNSDTEVILKSYLEYADACPEKLDGQFAFAIWDNERERLFLARDRFGEKPLYVSKQGDTLFFASEIKALLATGQVAAEIDPVSLDNYLSLMYVPPWRSIYKNITPLPPAHRAVWENGSYREERYWKLTKEPLVISFDEAAARVRETLDGSVRSRMVADVEVGAFLSGGMDSSIVVRLAQKISDRPLKTFSAGFEGFIDELPYAKEIAALARTDHTEAQIKENLADVFLEVSRYFDEPFADSSNIPTSLISKLARGKVKVALSGDGGDELFWGYGHYTRFSHLPKIQTLLNALSGTDAYAYFKKSMLSQFSHQERSSLLLDKSGIETDLTARLDLSEAQTPLEKINLIDYYLGLPGDMLTKVDRASMMHSLEVRSPFLNPELAQLAYNLPAAYKTDGRRGKIIFEKAFGDLLPEDFFARKKQGFGAPLSAWLHKPEFKKMVDEWLTPEARIGSLLDMKVVEKYIEGFYGGDTRLQYKVWILLSLEAWLRTRA
jgi:asparagine synthase (glutamine-hydrolysing)